MTMTRTLAKATMRIVVIALIGVPVLIGLGAGLGLVRTTTLLTGSMSPELPAGAFLLERPVPAGEVRTGDIITFTPPGGGELVTHRVRSVARVSGGIVARTQGDANNSLDPWQVQLTGQQVWKVAVHVPGVGPDAVRLRNAFNSLGGARLLLPFLLVAALAVSFLRQPPTRVTVDEVPEQLAEKVQLPG
jgi:signal peptidase